MSNEGMSTFNAIFRLQFGMSGALGRGDGYTANAAGGYMFRHADLRSHRTKAVHGLAGERDVNRLKEDAVAFVQAKYGP